MYAASPGGSARSITRTLDREILDFTWFSDGRLLLTGYDELQSAIWMQTENELFKKLNTGEVVEVYETQCKQIRIDSIHRGRKIQTG